MKEKVFFGKTEVILTWIDNYSFFKLGHVAISSCFVIPKLFSCSTIILTKNNRGIDFIGGHVEKNEKPYSAMIREAKEEASITVLSSVFLGAIEVFNPNWKAHDKYPETSYQLFYLTEDYTIDDFVQTHECSERVFVDLSEVESKHHLLLETHKTILKNI